MDVTSCHELLADGQHGRVAALLSDLKARSDDAGDTARSATIDAAIAACETCGELSREVDRCRRGARAASDRERSLRRGLDQLLDILIGRPAAAWSPQRRPARTARPRRGDEPHPPLGPATSQTALAVFALGPAEVYRDGELLPEPGGTKGQAVLRYLLLRRREHTPKEVLMELLWPGADPVAARRNLHQAAYSLRRWLGPERRGAGDVLVSRGDCYFLHPALELWLDFEQFEHHVDVGGRHADAGRHEDAEREYGAAASLYRGELFGDRPYEAWTAPERERLRALHRQAIEWLSDRADARGEHLASVALLQRVLGQDPLDEPAHQRLMRAYAAQGQRGLAARQYRVCRRLLEQRLGLEPSRATQEVGRELGLLSERGGEARRAPRGRARAQGDGHRRLMAS
jgi:DNA-binding SARP family transcriptional activator